MTQKSKDESISPNRQWHKWIGHLSSPSDSPSSAGLPWGSYSFLNISQTHFLSYCVAIISLSVSDSPSTVSSRMAVTSLSPVPDTKEVLRKCLLSKNESLENVKAQCGEENKIRVLINVKGLWNTQGSKSGRLAPNEVLRIAFAKQWQSVWFLVDEECIGIYQIGEMFVFGVEAGGGYEQFSFQGWEVSLRRSHECSRCRQETELSSGWSGCSPERMWQPGRRGCG